jgi:putative transposase
VARKNGRRYTEEQIIRILNEVEAGTPVADVCRKHNVAEATVYRWRKQYGNMEAEQLRRLKQLEAENRRLKQIVGEQALDIAMLKDLLGKNWSALD